MLTPGDVCKLHHPDRTTKMWCLAQIEQVLVDRVLLWSRGLKQTYPLDRVEELGNEEYTLEYLGDYLKQSGVRFEPQSDRMKTLIEQVEESLK